jgi:hypothetical protein
MTQKKITKTISKTKTAADIVEGVMSAPPVDEKAKKVRTLYKDKAVSDSASLTIERVTQSLTKAGLDITKTLNSVRDLFESEIAALHTIRDAIEAKQEELAELYEKEVIAASLTELVLKYEASKAELSKREDETRKAWAREQMEYAVSIKERNDSLTKARLREQEEFEYNKNIERRNAEDSWKAMHAKRVMELEQHEEEKRKNWEEREQAIRKLEEEIASTKSKLDNFDATVQAAVDKQVAIIGSAMKSKHDTEARIKALEFESEKKLVERDNASLRELLLSKEKEISQLRAALEKKDSEVKEVAVAAMSAQSGKQALAAVQEMSQNQSGKK